MVTIREKASLIFVASFPPAIHVVLLCDHGVELEAIYDRPRQVGMHSSIVPSGKEIVWRLK
jgi:hypothetical protein